MATMTGNEYDHITISDGTNQVVHPLKDAVARNTVVVSDSEPSSVDGNKVWIREDAEEEYTVPTYDELSDLESAMAAMSGQIVSTSVRKSIYALLEAALYEDDDLADHLNTVKSWSDVATSLTLNQSSASISGADTAQLIATTEPSGLSVMWESSDGTVATVNGYGLVTGVGNGTARIRATVGSLSAVCEVTVTGFATVTSIDAVYTQSGAVFTTDTLNVLRDDLVVTAYYNDGTSVVVTGYTLQGSLQAGTSTVQVLFGGKTDTVSVYVMNGLPSGYTQYDCIRNANVWVSASQNPTIDTGLDLEFGSENYEHFIEFAFDAGTVTNDGGLYGLRKQSGTPEDSITIWQKYVSTNTGAFYVVCRGTATGWISTAYGDRNVVVITFENGDAKVIVNDQVAFTATPGTFDVDSTAHFTLFKAQTGASIEGTSGYTKQYHKIYKYYVKDLTTGTYVAYFVPCKNANNEAGFYDTARGAFYTAFTGASNLTALND